MDRKGLRLYAFLAQLPPLRNYRRKLALIAAFGICIPILASTFYLFFSDIVAQPGVRRVIAVIGIATVSGAVLTIGAIYALLEPIELTARQLRRYVDERKPTTLPSYFPDEAGQMMADIQYTIEYLEQLAQTVDQAAALDQLTGVYNRRIGERRLTEDLARCRRDRYPISVARIDVDHFRAINDDYGSDVGNSCLKHIVVVISRTVRQGDWVARWSGDEFIVAFWSASEEVTCRVIERVCITLKESRFVVSRDQLVPLTISAGIAQYDDGDTPLTLLAKAGDALREAQERGYDRVICYSQAFAKGQVQLIDVEEG